MPLGYGYSHSAIKWIQLVRFYQGIILIQCDLKPVATVCDQGGTNIAAINLLIQETRRSLHSIGKQFAYALMAAFNRKGNFVTIVKFFNMIGSYI